MKRGLDSAYPPSPAQIAEAKAAGYDAWLGYFAGPNILNGWSDADFENVLAGGLQTGAYCSGWSDPAAVSARAAALGIISILDDESAIRSLGADDVTQLLVISQNRRTARAMYPKGAARPALELVDGKWQISAWVQPWLDMSGAGLYGNLPVFAGARASRYVFAAYPGVDPDASWPSYYPRPADCNPCGWQWQGTHAFAGASVDSTYFDDGFWAFGPSPGHLTGDDDMLYVGPFHPLSTSLKVFAQAGTIYNDPSTSALPVGTVAVNSSVSVDGYAYSSSGVQSTDRGAGAGPGIDYVWWHRTEGNWQPDNDLITVGVAGAPVGAVLSQLPTGMKLYLAKESELANLGGGVTLAQVQQAIADALAKLPASATMDQVNQAVIAAIGKLPGPGLSKDQVDAEILTALGNLPKPAPGPHHHGVLGIINTGPVIPD